MVENTERSPPYECSNRLMTHSTDRQLSARAHPRPTFSSGPRSNRHQRQYVGHRRDHRRRLHRQLSPRHRVRLLQRGCHSGRVHRQLNCQLRGHHRLHRRARRRRRRHRWRLEQRPVVMSVHLHLQRFTVRHMTVQNRGSPGSRNTLSTAGCRTAVKTA